MLEIHDLQKSFGDLHVLRGINLNIQKGDVVAVLGSSGRSTPPTSDIAACSASRKFSSGRSTVASRIARTSASTDRPCLAALPRNRACVRSSSCLIVRVPITSTS